MIKKNTNPCEVAVHFNKENHVLSDSLLLNKFTMLVTVIALMIIY